MPSARNHTLHFELLEMNLLGVLAVVELRDDLGVRLRRVLSVVLRLST